MFSGKLISVFISHLTVFLRPLLTFCLQVTKSSAATWQLCFYNRRTTSTPLTDYCSCYQVSKRVLLIHIYTRFDFKSILIQVFDQSFDRKSSGIVVIDTKVHMSKFKNSRKLEQQTQNRLF